MSAGQAMDFSLQQLADENYLISVDRISMGRIVLTFSNASEVICRVDDPEYTNCRFRLIENNASAAVDPTGKKVH